MYTSLVVIHTKNTGWRQNDSNVHGRSVVSDCPLTLREVESGIIYIIWLVRTQPLSIIRPEIHNVLCAAIHNLAGADAAQRSPPGVIHGCE